MEYLSKVLHTVEYSNTAEFRYLELGCLEILPVIYFFFRMPLDCPRFSCNRVKIYEGIRDKLE